ncbi:MAG: hypothetical protein H6739_03560 [Alphaproteobacteria bacterium]|nr:hypothetical protein [Alphaproteobacteria bacterium]
MLLLLLACTKSTPVDDTAPAFTPTLPVAACGMAPYDLLPLDQVGLPLDWDALDNFALTSGGVDALLGLVGVEGLTPVPYGASVYRFRYTTQDRGALQESTGLIALPTGGAAAEPWPVVLMLHGFAGTFDACAPSGDDLIGPAQPALLASQGFVVIAPDYIGLNGFGEGSTAPHAPLIGEQVAIGSLDAWRAGRALLEGEMAEALEGPLRDDLLIWGASQGGHAAVFTELAAPHYAPEADILAVVASTTAHDLTAVVQDAVTRYTDASGLSALALARMWSWYAPDVGLDTLLVNEEPYYFADTLAALLDSDPEECAFDDLVVEVDAVEEIYAPGFLSAAQAADWDAAAPWGCFIQENSLSMTSIPRASQVPVLLIYGEDDTLIVPPLQEPDHAAMCDDGWVSETLQCAGAPHPEATLWSLPEQFAWMRDRLAGVPWDPECAFAEPACCAGTPEDEGCGDR